jgi:predicted ribosome quality control (RQC) complex YloA/Tae2 family protein|uniref:NFACT RNA-binding domain-containing protein n=1 Tax=viral metagenome TaxID=1070528 RepID=A0A6C0IJY5_9ZZZZ
MITKNLFIPAISSEIEFYIGENAQDNFDMIDMCKPTDMWFHLHNASSSHVIANMPSDKNYNRRQISKIIIQGAKFCKEHSKARSNKDTEIIYTRLVNIVKTQVVGQVNVGESKIVTI